MLSHYATLPMLLLNLLLKLLKLLLSNLGSQSMHHLLTFDLTKILLLLLFFFCLILSIKSFYRKIKRF